MVEEIFGNLADKRRLLFLSYSPVLLAFVVSEILCLGRLIGLFTWCLSGQAPQSCNRPGASDSVLLWGSFVMIFLVFLWGGGRITNQLRSHQTWRNLPSIIITAVLVATNAVALFLNFEDWAPSAPVFGSNYDSTTATIFAVAALSSFLWLFCRFRKSSRRAALIGLIEVVLFTSWITFSVALPTAAVEDTHPKGSELIPSSYILLFVAMYELLFSTWVAIYLLQPRALGEPSLSTTTMRTSAKGGPYIDSAKTIATLLMVITFFGIQQATSHALGLDQIMESRAMFSRDLVRSYVSSFPDFQNWRHTEGKAASKEDIYLWLEHNLPKTYPRKMPWADSVEVKVVAVPTGSFDFFETEPRKMFKVSVSEYNSVRAWYTHVDVDFSRLASSPVDVPEDATIAVQNGITATKDEDFASLYFRTEGELLRKQVALPSSGFSFPVGQVVWVCLIVTVVILVLLDDRIRNVFRDPELGSGEPWLILDADRFIARFLASIWLVSIFLGPAMLSVLVVRMASLEARSVGSSSHLASELFVYCALVVVVACCALLSVVAISDILRLRVLQSLRRNAHSGTRILD